MGKILAAITGVLDRLGITTGGVYTAPQPLDADLTALAAISGQRGDVIIYGASGWQRLAPGTSGHALTSNGAAADPSYQAVGSSGWTDNGTTVTTTTATDGVGIGATPNASEILDVTGNSTRKDVSLKAGTGTGGTPGGELELGAGNATAGNGTGGRLLLYSGDGDGSGAGGALEWVGGSGGDTGTGASVSITAGPGGNTSGGGGTVAIAAGDAAGGNSQGGALDFTAGDSSGNAAGADASIFGGSGGSTNGVGGVATLQGGSGSGSGAGGVAKLQGGDPGGSGTGGAAHVLGGFGGASNNSGGAVVIAGGDAVDGTGTGGAVSIDAGDGGDTAGAAGSITITGGNGRGGNANGGGVTITGGAKDGSGTAGRVLLVDGGGAKFTFGTGSPESSLTAPVGSLFLRDDGGPGTAIYAKLSGSGNTGWVTFAPITPWAAASSVTGSWTTNTTHMCVYRRVGDSIEVMGQVSLTGAPDSVALTVSLPDSLTVDETKDTANGVPFIGSGMINDAGTGTRGPLILNYNSGTDVVTFQIVTTAPSTTTNVTQAVPITFANGDSVIYRYTLPISGW